MTVYSLGYIYRRPDLDVVDFRHHYEGRHTRLAQTLLPPFCHYVRNHVIASAGVLPAPDCVSEFGFARSVQREEAMTVLASARGRSLLEDELQFMDKPRNRSFLVHRRDWRRDEKPSVMPAPKNWLEKTTKTKYILRRAAGPQDESPARFQLVLELMRTLDPALASATFCAPLDFAAEGLLSCWLCQTDARMEPEQLWQGYKDKNLPLLCCATVDAIMGYPFPAD